MKDEQIWRECHADACRQGRDNCPFPIACEVSEPVASKRSWFWSDLSVIGIGVLCAYGYIAGWFA